MAVAYVLDEVFAGHTPPGRHPERPERYAAARDALRGAGLADRGLALPSRAATDDELLGVHTAGYLAELERALPGAPAGSTPTPTSPRAPGRRRARPPAPRSTSRSASSPAARRPASRSCGRPA